ncbi:hypothetical protein [Alteromonas oceanisediminis]|uniref:hypothetical protein n=1 Tax=Alteromonas oceanisediminis TaxID=2836180 RepID=UPI001BDB6117|nr:hypothetical protein [Alteromonas oceanisediminis]MBT0588066.1 hypothetical protein [Alteromonas oceanisediminis]
MTLPHTKKTLVSALVIASSVTLLSGCIIHVGGPAKGDYEFDLEDDRSMSSVLGDVSVSEGKQVNDVSSVNGSVTLHNRVTAQEVSTVNGSISIKNDVTVESVEIVNGDIQIGERFKAHDDVESVNGDISIDAAGDVSGDVETVNGDISLNNTLVGEDVETVNGDIHLFNNSVVMGDIIYERSNNKGWNQQNKPTLRIEKGSEVSGEIVLHRDVNLVIDDATTAAKVVRRFSGE